MLVNCDMFKIETLMLRSKKEIYNELSMKIPKIYIAGPMEVSLINNAEALYMLPDNIVYQIVGTTTADNTEILAEYSTEAAALKVLQDLSMSTGSKQTFVFPKDTDKAANE